MKKVYKKPFLTKVTVDMELSLVMESNPPIEPNLLGPPPGYVQKGIKLLIR